MEHNKRDVLNRAVVRVDSGFRYFPTQYYRLIFVI